MRQTFSGWTMEIIHFRIQTHDIERISLKTHPNFVILFERTASSDLYQPLTLLLNARIEVLDTDYFLNLLLIAGISSSSIKTAIATVIFWIRRTSSNSNINVSSGKRIFQLHKLLLNTPFKSRLVWDTPRPEAVNKIRKKREKVTGELKRDAIECLMLQQIQGNTFKTLHQTRRIADQITLN